jgi:hypothetical protein
MEDNIFKYLGIDPKLLLSGFFGALLLVRKEGKSWKENVTTLVTGATSATFLTPFILEFFAIQSSAALSFFGFVVGFGSIRIVEFFIDKYFKPKTEDDARNA